MTPFNDSVRMMRALVKNAPGADIDISEVSLTDRAFLLVTCSAQMIAYTISHQANRDADKALEGLEKLIPDLRKQIIAICETEGSKR